MLIAFLNQILFPLTAFALTSGPTQPEVQSFSPVGSSNLVDLFTGDFKYNIPLLDVGGYPVNLSYQSGVQMDQEASWVGLGWNLNVGAIVRNLRGVPDEFGGGTVEDKVVHTRKMKPNKTWGVSLGKDTELIGLNIGPGSVQGTLTLTHNNFTGFDMSRSLSTSLMAQEGAKHPWLVNLGVNNSARNGSGVRAQASYSGKMDGNGKRDFDYATGVASSINSRSGMRSLNLNAGAFYGKPSAFKIFGLSSWSQNIQLAHATYIPQIDFPMRTLSRNFSLKMGPGATNWIALDDAVITGFSSIQKLKLNTISSAAYGYLNLEKGKTDRNAILDFNREKDGGFSKETPHLPLTNLTYDTYAVTGQGISGAFRAFRGDVGVVFDQRVETSSDGAANFGLQINKGGNNVIGMDWKPNWMSAENGKWIAANEMLSKVNFAGTNANSPLYEAATFRMMGEQTRSLDAFDQARGNTDAVRPQLGNGLGAKAKAAWTRTSSDQNSQASPVSNPILRDARMPGNTAISVLSAGEADDLGLAKSIPNYAVNGPLTSPSQLPRHDTAAGRKGHHPSEFTVLSGDGSRYIYGVPAYNTKQKDVSFSIGAARLDTTPPNFSGSLYDYSSQISGNTITPKGRDGYLDVTETDPFAHSYLLSAYLSADYEDLTGDGPSPDDHGTYVKFNYSRDHAAYRWRVPFLQNHAKHNTGLRADPSDDKVTYSYGEKEIWYLHSIESRDYIALFNLSSREDGHGVAGEHGGISASMDLQRLDRIDLFARREYLNPPSGQAAIPIKSVHFVYDYTLCPGIPNNSQAGGKLTLKAIYSTFYQSQKGKMNSYRFHYDGSNPTYNIQESDRWGFYTPSLSNNLNSLKNADYPYVTQDAA
ncbi:MAG TPA: hypothetical protein ENJ82_11090, partial [Bacteroidetes bacterium]|nr:hypothetical protein [Bacteroidota bacterium]